MSAESKRTRRGFLFLVPPLLAAGVGASIYLVLEKLRVQYGIDYTASCTTSATMDCGAVQTHESSTVLGVPIAIWAIPTYVVMLVMAWFGLVEPAPDAADAAEVRTAAVDSTDLLLLFGSATLLYSVYLVYLELFVIGAFCIGCIVMDVVNVGIFLCALMATPNRFLDALGNAARVALQALRPTVACAVAFALTLALALVWLHHEKDVVYHGASRQALADAEHLIDSGQTTRAVEILGALTARKDQYTPLALALLDQAESRMSGHAPEATDPLKPIEQLISAGRHAEAIDGLQPFLEPPGPHAGRARQLMERAVEARNREAAAAAPAPSSAGEPASKPAPPAPAAVEPAPAPVARAAPQPAPSQAPTVAPARGVRTELGWSHFDIALGPDDFVLGPEKAAVTFVMIADFECSFCKYLSQNAEQLRKKYASSVRFAFKFYPMDGSCNPRMGGERMHPNACHSAFASYCAGKQGKFWEAHDKLFAMQGQLDPDKVLGYMKEIGADVAVWKECMAGDGPKNRILSDIQMAARADVHGTPRTYINGRLVSGASSVPILEYYLKKAFENPEMRAEPLRRVKPLPTMAPMVKVRTGKGETWIDRYEATVDTEGRAVSLPLVNAMPASWLEAKAACEKAGKRLCTEEEWASACTGEPAVDDNGNGWFNDDDIEGNRYAYGYFYEKGACHDAEEDLTGNPILTGGKDTCVSKYDVYDLTGNIGEWIENDQAKASLVGGSFGSGEGAACNRRGTLFGPGIRNNTTGFRCCAEQMVPNATEDKEDLAPLPISLIGRKVPVFAAKTRDEKEIGPNWFEGKVSYVTFFASWCGSCKRELPELRKWVEELGSKGFQVLAIGVDRHTKFSEELVDKYEPNYAVAFDPDSLTMTQFDIAAMPTSFVVDRKGIVRGRIVGFKQEEAPGTRALVETLLSQK